MNYKRGDNTIAQKANYTGNNVKSMTISLEASLKKLRTNYIDIFYVHWVRPRSVVSTFASSLTINQM